MGDGLVQLIREENFIRINRLNCCVLFFAGCGEDLQLTKNRIGLLILRDIFDKYGDQTVSFERLNEHVQLKIRDIELDEVKRFKDVAGSTLQNFLKENKDTFEMNVRKKKRYVKMNRKSRTDSMFSDMLTKEQAYYRRNSVESTTSDTYFDAKSEFDDSLDDQDSNNWTVVARNKQRPRFLQTETLQPDDKTSVVYGKTERFDICKFQSLICKGSDRDHCFISKKEIYTSNKFKFMQDVVSMWNTPQRTKSYIILGIRENKQLPHDLLGLEKPESNLFYQKLFHEDYFTVRPVFICYHIELDRKHFNVIEILSSFGCGMPSIVKKGGKLSGVTLLENQMWIRNCNQNKECKPTDPTTSSIYQWFMGVANREGSPDITLPKINMRKSTKNVETCTALFDNSSEDSITGNFDDFWESVNAFSKGHFISISGDISNATKRLEALTLVPWIAVYDFDIMSHSDGLLNASMDFIERRRSLHISTWKDPAQFINEQSTSWCFMRGRREISDSRTDEKDGAIEDANTWLRTTKHGIDANCEQLAIFSEDYTVLTVVLFWPTNEKLSPIIHRFVLRMFEHLSISPKIVLCLSKEPTTEKAKLRLNMFCDDFEDSLIVYRIETESLCHGIMSHMKNYRYVKNEYSLPTADGCNDLSINDKDAVWLKEDFEVLYRDNTYLPGNTNSGELQDAIEKFYRGGSLHWFVRYMCDAEQIDIERDLMKTLEENITKLAEKYKTAVITLAHAPGSGGTTLAQRVLWKLHMIYPCVENKIRSASHMEE